MFLRNGLEPWHLLIVAVVLILLFGSKKLPDTARALGKSLRILKSETKAMREDSGDPAPAAAPPVTAAHTTTDAPPRPVQ
jgi:sec-independent protein translocase protein TatA